MKNHAYRKKMRKNISSSGTRVSIGRLSALLLTSLLVIIFPVTSFAQAPSSKAASTKNSVPAIQEKKRNQPPDVVVRGQVFVVTKGASNVKLALVTVAAFLEQDVQTQFSRIAEVEARTNNDIREAMAANDAATGALKELHSREMALNANRRANPSSDFEEYQAKKQELQKMRDESGAEQALANLIRVQKLQLEFQGGVRTYISLLRDPIAATKTDPDGNFELTLPAGNYVTVANSSRLTPGFSASNNTELYSWIIRVDATKPNQKLQLSNDNMIDTNCAECGPLPVRK